MSEPTTCAAPRAATAAELHPWETHALDIAKCDRTEFVVALYSEFEKPGLRWETWPQAVQQIFVKQFDKWLAANAARAVRAVTFGVHQQTCVVVFHHSPKAAT